MLKTRGKGGFFIMLKKDIITEALTHRQIFESDDIKVETIYRKIKRCILENEELTKLRDYLLPLLMNGQVGFKD